MPQSPPHGAGLRTCSTLGPNPAPPMSSQAAQDSPMGAAPCSTVPSPIDCLRAEECRHTAQDWNNPNILAEAEESLKRKSPAITAPTCPRPWLLLPEQWRSLDKCPQTVQKVCAAVPGTPALDPVRKAGPAPRPGGGRRWKVLAHVLWAQLKLKSAREESPQRLSLVSAGGAGAGAGAVQGPGWGPTCREALGREPRPRPRRRRPRPCRWATPPPGAPGTQAAPRRTAFAGFQGEGGGASERKFPPKLELGAVEHSRPWGLAFGRGYTPFTRARTPPYTAQLFTVPPKACLSGSAEWKESDNAARHGRFRFLASQRFDGGHRRPGPALLFFADSFLEV
ncbi:uncharacterized protein [Macaca fascicularis]|uniref:uncharacterized protein n=1 Tax=Macaca fascicularis TaxID=9541 RepID=UPI003D1546EF